MITLTTPTVINSVLGGNAPVSYDKLVLTNIRFDTYTNTVHASVNLTSTANPDMQTIVGTFSMNATDNVLEMAVPSLDFYRRIKPTAGQRTALVSLVRNAQDSLESGLISLSLVAGAQSTGV